MPKLNIGQQGIEKSFNKKLVGIPGNKEVEINSSGRVVREISKISSIKGGDINLSIDTRLQHFLFNKLSDHKAGSVVVLDVDGVLTDGKILISSNSEESKFFNVEDGTGAAIAHYANLPIALISGRYSKSTSIRAKELQIDHCYQDTLNKTKVLHELMELYSVTYDEIAYIGDLSLIHN